MTPSPEHIIRLRAKMRLTQAQLGERLGYGSKSAQKAVSRLESGSVTMPRVRAVGFWDLWAEHVGELPVSEQQQGDE